MLVNMISIRKICVLYMLISVEMLDLCVSSLLIEQKFTKQKFDGSNMTSEIVSKNSSSEISCGMYCNGIVACVSFLFSFALQTCLLLDELVTTNPKLPSDGIWLYYVKASECPASWEINGENKYCFVKNSLHWKSAKDSCISMGAHLLAIETEAEQTWINVKASGYAWWIGGTDAKSEDTYYWEHTYDVMNFSNWDDGQPNGAQDENCAVMLYWGGWQDYPCSSIFYYICEK